MTMAWQIPGYTEVDLKDVVEECLREIAAKSSAVTPSFNIEELNRWLSNKVRTNGFALGDVLTQFVKEGRLKLQCFYEEPSHAHILFIYQR